LATLFAQVLVNLGRNLQSYHGLDQTEKLWLQSTFFAVQIISVPLSANLVGPTGLRRLLLGTSVLVVLTAVFAIFAQGFAITLLSQILFALTSSVCLPLGILIVFRTFGSLRSINAIGNVTLPNNQNR